MDPNNAFLRAQTRIHDNLAIKIFDVIRKVTFHGFPFSEKVRFWSVFGSLFGTILVHFSHFGYKKGSWRQAQKKHWKKVAYKSRNGAEIGTKMSCFGTRESTN